MLRFHEKGELVYEGAWPGDQADRDRIADQAENPDTGRDYGKIRGHLGLRLRLDCKLSWEQI